MSDVSTRLQSGFLRTVTTGAVDARGFAERLVDRHLAGRASLDELLENGIHAGSVLFMRMRLARAAARSRDAAARLERLDDLAAALREIELPSAAGHGRGQDLRPEALEDAEWRMYVAMAATGGCYTEATLPLPVRSLHPRVRQAMIQDRALLGIDCGEQPMRFPAAQFRDDGRVYAGLDRIARALGEREVAHIFNFFIYGNADLGDEAPIDRLDAGDLASVLAAARLWVFA
jgi:hypothetical protein